MKIRLQNKTRYRDEDLRVLLRATFANTGYRTREVAVEVVAARRNRVSGCASLGRWAGTRMHRGRWMRLCIPRECTVQRVVLVAVHEVLHLNGANHGDMTEEQLLCTGPLPEWAKELVLREREERVVDRAALRADRLEHAEKMLRKAETRCKRAESIRARWKRSVVALRRAQG